MRHYVALVHKDPDSDFGVSFPDFPGCISAGTTLAEAASMAAEALAGHIELMADEGLPVPEPADLDTIMENPENRSGVPVLIPAATRKPVKAVGDHVTLPEDGVEEVFFVPVAGWYKVTMYGAGAGGGAELDTEQCREERSSGGLKPSGPCRMLEG